MVRHEKNERFVHNCRTVKTDRGYQNIYLKTNCNKYIWVLKYDRNLCSKFKKNKGICRW